MCFYNSLFAMTYDEDFAKVSGINCKLINYLISILTSIVVVWELGSGDHAYIQHDNISNSYSIAGIQWV